MHAVALIDDGNNCGCGPVSGFLLENITRWGGGGGGGGAKRNIEKV